MTFSTPRIAAIVTCVGLLPSLATAQNVITQNTTIRDALCVGASCLNAETFGTDAILLSNFNNGINIKDTSAATFPSNDWRLVFNDSTEIATGGEDYFALEDVTGGTVPFRINAGAPATSFHLNSDGNIGLGTSMPIEDLHIEGGFQAGLRMNAALTPGGLRSFQMTVNDAGFSVFNSGTGQTPFLIHPNATNFMFHILPTEVVVNDGGSTTDFKVRSNGGGTLLFTDASTNNVGIGTANPGAPLTVSTPDTFAFFRIEALGASPNTSADMTYTGGPNGNGEFRINVVDGDGPEMRVDAEGFVIATTGFKVGSDTLNVPDYVFAPGYDLRPLSEVAMFVAENSHLPDVPSAADIAADGLDMTDMQLTLLKKVEELTLYTLAQEDRIAELEATLSALTTAQ